MAKGCEEKARVRGALRQIGGISEAKFNCSVKAALFIPGSVAIAPLEHLWPVAEGEPEDPYNDMEPGEIRVVIRAIKGRKLLVVAFPDQPLSMYSLKKHKLIRNVALYPDHFKLTGETVPVMQCCGWPKDWPTDEHRFNCQTCNPVDHEDFG